MNLLLHGIGDTRRRRASITVDDALRADAERALRHGADQSAVRQEVLVQGRQRRGRRPRREDMSYLREDFWATTSQQAAQLPPARPVAAEDQRPSGHRRARQRALRGRRRRDGPAAAAARVRRPHAAAAADRHLLRAGREGQRAVLRPQAASGDAVDRRSSGSTTSAPTSTSRSRRDSSDARRPRRLRRLLQRREPARAQPRPSASSRSRTTSWSPATRLASTSSGCATSRWRTPTTCPRPR